MPGINVKSVACCLLIAIVCAKFVRFTAGRHKKGRKHEFGLQKGWSSPRNSTPRDFSIDDPESFFAEPDPLELDLTAQDADDEQSDTNRTTPGHNESLQQEATHAAREVHAENPVEDQQDNTHDPLYPDWEKHYDDTEESYFYFCPGTGQSVWEEDMCVPIAVFVVNVTSVSRVLPCCAVNSWSTEFDEDSGRYYYVNQVRVHCFAATSTNLNSTKIMSNDDVSILSTVDGGIPMAAKRRVRSGRRRHCSECE